jgi:hypothetical protein
MKKKLCWYLEGQFTPAKIGEMKNSDWDQNTSKTKNASMFALCS